MKLQKLLIMCLSAALLIQGQAFAQRSAEYDAFANGASKAATLFRGACNTKYPIAYNGNYYWDSPIFEQGEVICNGKWYGPLSINVNANLQQLLIKQGEDNVEISIPCEIVESFKKGSRVFVNLFNAGYDMPKGFYEVLHDGRHRLLKRVDKVLKSDANAQNGISIGYSDPNFNPSIPRYFQYTVHYYMQIDDYFEPVVSRNDIWKYCTKDAKRSIKSQLRRLNMTDIEREKLYVEVLNRLENEN